MKRKSFSLLSFAVMQYLLIALTTASESNLEGIFNEPKTRRRLSPHDDIAEFLLQSQKQSRQSRNLQNPQNPRKLFTLVGIKHPIGTPLGAGGGDNDENGEIRGINPPDNFNSGENQFGENFQGFENVQYLEMEEFELNVKEAIPSVTSATTYSTYRDADTGVDGKKKHYPVKDSGIIYLVADPSDTSDGSSGGGNTGNNNFALIAVNTKSHEVQGIAQTRGEGMVSISQIPVSSFPGYSDNNNNDGQNGMSNDSMVTIVQEVEEMIQEGWQCDTVDDVLPNESSGEVTLMEEEMLLDDGGQRRRKRTKKHRQRQKRQQKSGQRGRRLEDWVDEHDARDHHHRHEGNDHNHHNHGHFHKASLRGKGGILAEIDHIIGTLGGIANINFKAHQNTIQQKQRNLYATDKFPQLYTYQVDLYIEIDDDFVALHGDPDSQEALELAIQYVDAIITAANSIFEREIDSHLHVAHVAVTNVYDSTSTTTEALEVMLETYASEDGWHYTEGFGIDLHHAILGRNLNGGKAYVGAICRSDYGFGVSSGIRGNNNNYQFWDIWVVSHEIGHNFGTSHTHTHTDESKTGYDPVVDTCGISPPSSCSGQLPLGDSATIMSYCNLCAGNLDNILLTFGGYWLEDNRNKLENWRNSEDLVGNVTYESRRVPKNMWEHVSSRECVEPNFEVPIVSCVQDSDCADGNSCTIDTCSVLDGQCVNTMTDNCCGNYVCEYNEDSCEDCGPFTLKTSSCKSCYTPNGFMFNVQARESAISINSLYYRHYTGQAEVKIHTAPGTYNSIQRDSTAWTQIGFQSIDVDDAEYLRVDFTPINLNPLEERAFYVHSTGLLLVEQIEEDPIAQDGFLNILNFGRYVGATEFGGGTNGYSWNGRIEYNIQAPDAPEDPPTSKPTALPTKKPTSIPSRAPTTKPTTPPTPVPSRAPTMMPTAPPTKNPTAPPSKNPTSMPTKPPTNVPTRLPTPNPSRAPTSKPTTIPTHAPTRLPTLNPSRAPTSKPTTTPTNAPTRLPTPNPSRAPTSKPTTPPTTGPSPLPVSPPTTSPSKTSSPSLTPSSSSPPTDNPPTPSPMESSFLWYMNWKTYTCQSDGEQEHWQTMFETVDECCHWNLAPSPHLYEKCMPSPSPSGVNNIASPPVFD